jgi:hypothetical protein
MYLRLRSVNEEDPLEFWQDNNQPQYPFLAHVARKILKQCATSAPVENMFSTMALLFNGQRSTLASQEFSQSKHVHDNYTLYFDIEHP